MYVCNRPSTQPTVFNYCCCYLSSKIQTFKVLKKPEQKSSLNPILQNLGLKVNTKRQNLNVKVSLMYIVSKKTFNLAVLHQ